MSTENATTVTTGVVRLSYAHLFEPAAGKDGGDKKYSVTLLVDKKDKATVAKLRAAEAAAVELGKVKKFAGKTKGIALIIRDGDEDKEDENYKGMLFISAKSNTAPGIVDKHRNAILDSSKVYSGCYALANINFYPYNFEGKIGVACGLNHIMFVRDGERLAGGQSVESAFADVDVDAFEDDLV